MSAAGSRRDFFRGLLGGARRTGPAAPPAPAPLVTLLDPALAPAAPACPEPSRFGRGKPLPVLRPPGAIEESAFLSACTRCGKCLEACPHQALVLAPERFRAAAGTPMLAPLDSPCRLCDDLPCVAACEPKALRADLPLRMGTAVISPIHCLAHRNSPCSACVEQCPVPAALRFEAGRPVVVADACTGCGVCQHVCPAPQNAVLILPARDRPRPPPADQA